MVPEVLSMAAGRGYRDIMEDKEKAKGKIQSSMKRNPMNHIERLNQKEMN